MQRPLLAADLARGTRTLLLIVMLLIGLLVQPGTASAQSVCLPLPRLLTTMPMGGRAGTSLDVTVTGEHITGATALRFSHPGLSAVVKKAADGADVPGTFVVTIKADALPGAYEAAVVSPAGVSASRIFCVGSLPEVIRPGDDAPFEMPVGAIANGVARGQQIDTYRIAARGGRRLLIECAAPGIDSRMHPVVILADHEGRDLVVERRGGVLDFTPPSDGTYLVKVHDLCHRGGREFFYRLVVQEAEAGVEPPRHPIAPAVASFSWPPAGLAAAPARREAEPARSEAGAASGGRRRHLRVRGDGRRIVVDRSRLAATRRRHRPGGGRRAIGLRRGRGAARGRAAARRDSRPDQAVEQLLLLRRTAVQRRLARSPRQARRQGDRHLSHRAPRPLRRHAG
jgi:hypothetical protein